MVGKVHAACEAGLAALGRQQLADGRLEGEMVWNAGLSAQYVVTAHLLGRSDRERAAWLRYFLSQQLDDGSWPMHREGEGFVYVTFLVYVALRVLGLSADDDKLVAARRWLMKAGGLAALPAWGKVWAALLGLCPWSAVPPIPPELFMAPAFLPVHPRRFYMHTRSVYLAMSYLWGSRVVYELPDGLGDALRQELGVSALSRMPARGLRHRVASTDLYEKPLYLVSLTLDIVAGLERWWPSRLRRRALKHVLGLIVDDLRAAQHMSLSPVDGLLYCLVLGHSSLREQVWHQDLEPAFTRLSFWMFEDDEGGKRVTGARSACWDTAFALRAFTEREVSGMDDDLRQVAIRAGRWLAGEQLSMTMPTVAAKPNRLGGWSFSGWQHPWPVSDCTAEALSASLSVAKVHGDADLLSEQSVHDACRLILRYRNPDGGFGSFAKRQGGRWLNWLNVSQMFSQCMVESSYVECTASCVGALVRSLDTMRSGALRHEVNTAIRAAVVFLQRQQKPDGSYHGAWGICYSYGIFHAVEGLAAAGVSPRDPSIARALDWLEANQKADGGWGEHWSSGMRDRYVPHARSQATMSAWALLALCAGGRGQGEAARRAAAFLCDQQTQDGSWPQDGQAGVFFRAGLVDYRLYKDIFPTWALARYAAVNVVIK